MLTEKEYYDLWNGTFSPLFGGAPNPPDDTYADYCIRECYFQDYLDLFRGKNTRGTIERQLSDGTILPCDPNDHTYFKEPANGSEINHEECLWYILSEKIQKELEEIKDQILLEKLKKEFPKIEYILIAEAPAKQVKKIADLKKKDQAKIGGKRYPNIINFNTYFYDPNQLKPTHYFSAPYKALVNKTSNHTSDIEKKIELIEYAIEGALLLDLFPFAIKYDSNLRNNIVSGEIHFNFWENRANSYSIKNRTDNLSSILSDELIGCFIGPPAIFVDLSSRLYYSLYKSRNKMKFNWREAEFACIGQNRSNNPDKTRIEEALGFL